MTNNTKYKQTEIGGIPENWKETTLGGTATFHYGKGLPQKARVDGGVPVFGSSGPTGYHNEALVNEPGYIIGRKGTVGTVYYSEEPFFPIDTVYYATQSDISCDFNFFYYLLKYLKLNELNSDSAVPGLNRKAAYSQKVRLPKSIAEQKQIASILSSLDDKIELNRKMNKTLEEIGKALFKHWFVDFEFPDENGKSYKSSGGKMVNSKIGEIPKGWEIKKISSLLELVKDGYRGNNKIDKIPYLPIDKIESESLGINEIASHEDAKSSLTKFKENDILFGAMRPYFFKVAIAPFDGLTRTTCFVLRPKDHNYLSFLLFYIFRQKFIDTATTRSQGSTIPYAKWSGSLSDLPIPTPPLLLVMSFNEIISSQIEKIKFSYFNSQALQSLRDSLLPRLMSGRLRV